MTSETNKAKDTIEGSGSERDGGSGSDKEHRDEPFPPELSKLRKFILYAFGYPVFALASWFILDQLCFGTLPSCICSTYIGFGVVIAILVVDRYLHHKLIVHEARREDVSEVEALFVEARTVEPTETGKMSEQEHFNRKRNELLAEVNRLEAISNRGWTEYQILSLNQMLIEFLNGDKLVACAQSWLEDLEDYAVDTAYGGYDQKQYDQWKQRIEEAVEKIDDAADKASKREVAKKMLEARLQTLLEHVASYKANWSEGSAILCGIRICSVLALPLLLFMALLPRIHPSVVENADKLLGFLNWGVLGGVGAIAAVLLNLRKADYVEVGNTEGRKELWRTVPGVALGILAGVLAYWMIAGGLISEGSVVPNLKSTCLEDVGISILWAVASGFCFEKVFDRMLTTTVGGT
jgi:hypothetical protein